MLSSRGAKKRGKFQLPAWKTHSRTVMRSSGNVRERPVLFTPVSVSLSESGTWLVVSLLSLHHTIVSEPEPFPVKKSQKLVVGDGLLSSCGVCLTQMLFSVEPLRLELREKLSAALRPGPRRSWASESWALSLGVEDEDKDEEEKEDWDRLSRLWWEWNWRMWRMDLPGGTSPAGPRTGHGFRTWKTKTIYYLKVV